MMSSYRPPWGKDGRPRHFTIRESTSCRGLPFPNRFLAAI